MSRLLPLLLVLVTVAVQASEVGVFPTQTWDVKAIELSDDFAGPPFLALAQSAEGYIYVGHERGVLEFDGLRWRELPLQTSAHVTVLGVTRGGALVVGGSEFLYLVADPGGSAQVQDMSEQLPEELHGSSDFWEFAEDHQRWCVRSNRRLICADSEGLHSFTAKPDSEFGRMFQTAGSILIQVPRLGLHRVTAQGPELIAGGEAFAGLALSSLVDGGDGDLAAVTAAPLAFWRWRSGEQPTLRRTLDPTALQPAIGIGVMVNDRRFALPEDHGGVAILDLDGEVVDRVNPQDAIGGGGGAQSLLVDHEGALWVAWKSAISRIEYPSRIQIFPLPPALIGQRLRLARTGHGLTTFKGGQLQVLRPQSAGKTWTFQPHGVPLPAMHIVDRLNGFEFAGTLNGLWSIAAGDGSNTVLSNEMVFAVAPVTTSDQQLWVGKRNGIAKVGRDGQRWVELENSVRLSFDVTSLAQAERRTLWVGSRASRVARLRLDEDSSLHNAHVEEWDQRAGLPEGQFDVLRIADRVYFYRRRDGLYEFADGRFHPSESIPQAESGPVSGVEAIDEEQLLIVSGRNRLRLLRRDITGVFRYQSSLFDQVALSEPIDSVHIDADGIVWLSDASKVTRIDPKLSIPDPEPQQVQIRSAIADGRRWQGREQGLLLDKGASLRVEYVLPSYRAPALNRYRSRIRHAEESSPWSRWSNETRRDFTNLPAGVLQFEVEAEDATGVSGGIAKLALTVQAPWYQSGWALLAFAFAAAAAIWAALQWRLRALQRRSEQLERLVDIKTEELQRAANTDPLTGLWNRHRFGRWLREQSPELVAQASTAAADDSADLIICVVDLDHFKGVNDRYGHAAGDLALKAVAEQLRRIKGADDMIFRFGGEEFVYLGLARHRDQGRDLAEAIVEAVATVQVELEDGVVLTLTASVGWSAFPFYRERADLFSLDYVVGVADRALYLAKQEGRNRAYGYLPNLPVDAIDRTHANWRTEAFNRHANFLRRVG